MRTRPAVGRHVASFALAVLVLGWEPRDARAEANPFEAWANMIAYAAPRYHGPTLPLAAPRPRPGDDGMVLRSERCPVSLHAPRGYSEAGAGRVLRALEHAYEWLHARDWPLPYSDGGAGGSLDFDVYLEPGSAHGASVVAETEVAWSALDAASGYALLDSGLPAEALERCSTQALVEAGLLGLDPAERAGARTATAELVTWLATGELGCDDLSQDTQAAPELGVLGSGELQSTGFALLLAMLSRRHDGGDGRFARELWEISRQRSEHASALHVEPTLWQALAAALEKAGESLDQVATELAVERYVANLRSSESGLPGLPSGAEVATRSGAKLGALPAHLSSSAKLGTYGSAYVLVDTAGAHDGGQLRVWLRGDAGVRWSLVALRLDADDRELGRMEAPPRRVPDSFLPVVLGSDTRRVVVVVTKLPWLRPDEAEADEGDADGFSLILDAGGAPTK